MGTKGKCLYFEGAKGGVGTTFLVSQIALYLSELKNQKVLLLQIGSLGDIHLYLGYDTAFSISTFLPYFEEADSLTLSALSKITNKKNALFFMSGPDEIFEVDKIAKLPSLEIFAILKTYFDYIIIDGGTNFSPKIPNIIDQADFFWTVINNDLSSFKRFLDVFKNFEDQTKNKHAIISNLNKSNAKKILKEFKNHLNGQIEAIFEKDEESSFYALSTGKSIFSQKNSFLKDSISQFIEEKILNNFLS